MPTLTIDQTNVVEVPAGKRLINALLDEGHADQHHSCGGIAKCTTCRVDFIAGEPEMMTQAEKDVLAANGIPEQFPNVRLSCQINCDADMSVKLLVPKPPAKNPSRPADEIQPPPVWVKK